MHTTEYKQCVDSFSCESTTQYCWSGLILFYWLAWLTHNLLWTPSSGWLCEQQFHQTLIRMEKRRIWFLDCRLCQRSKDLQGDLMVLRYLVSIDKWMNKWMNEWMNEWMNKINICIARLRGYPPLHWLHVCAAVVKVILSGKTFFLCNVKYNPLILDHTPNWQMQMCTYCIASLRWKDKTCLSNLVLNKWQSCTLQVTCMWISSVIIRILMLYLHNIGTEADLKLG